MPTLEELRCDDCAFRPGTEASKSERTVMLAQLCAEAGELFTCHRREGICAGYAAELNRLGAEWFAAQPEWKMALRRELIDLIHRAGDGELDLAAEMDKIMDRIDAASSGLLQAPVSHEEQMK